MIELFPSPSARQAAYVLGGWSRPPIARDDATVPAGEMERRELVDWLAREVERLQAAATNDGDLAVCRRLLAHLAEPATPAPARLIVQ